MTSAAEEKGEPTMAEYIDRDAAANIFEAPMWRGYSEPYTFEAHLAMVAVAKLIREEIGKIPAADVAPVGVWLSEPMRVLPGLPKRSRWI